MNDYLIIFLTPIGIFIIMIIFSFIRELIFNGYYGLKTIDKDDIILCASFSIISFFFVNCYYMGNPNEKIHNLSLSLVFIMVLAAGLYVSHLRTKIQEKEEIIEKLSKELKTKVQEK